MSQVLKGTFYISHITDSKTIVLSPFEGLSRSIAASKLDKVTVTTDILYPLCDFWQAIASCNRFVVTIEKQS